MEFLQNSPVNKLNALVADTTSHMLTFLQNPPVNKLDALIALVAVSAVSVAAAYIYLKKKVKGCLDRNVFKDFKLVKRTQINHNSARFRFALPTPTSVLGLYAGQFIRCRGIDREGKEVIRPYTPITLNSDVGYFELVVKMYPLGRMSHHFREMREGEYLAVKGPIDRFKYKPGQARSLGMLAGGTGITPMFQLIRAILENPKDKTTIRLLYANHTFEELDLFASKFPNHFKVYYVLTQYHLPTACLNILTASGGMERWQQPHIEEMIQSHCPPPSPDIKILRCGPPEMNKAMAAHLNELGYTKDMQFEF
ncbi:hypothetical protein RJ639_019169 [Escallonia herrerae]|uniref:cytochrome-b5 reductase n=1 Tax=Escallonia herrerae TaxID=1293975 RepID=A0AA89AJ61_9ASTE|nr:hypothetical protein RJ639_019169 [Escallonia herrerae]